MDRQANQAWRIINLLFLALVLLASVAGDAQENRVAQFGRYQGYSEPVYSNWIRTSQYVTVRDGIKLAVDIFRPVDSSGLGNHWCIIV